MEIIDDKSYLYLNKRMVNTGFTDEVVGKICVQGGCDEQQAIDRLLDILENRFRMYQYKKNNGVLFDTEDLFYWGDRKRYFDVTVKANTLERHNKIVAEVLDIINCDFKNTQFYVRLQYDNRTDWDRINEYMQQDFDIDNLPLSILSAFYKDMQYDDRKYSMEATEKLHELSNLFLSKFIDKKVIVNGNIKGYVHKLSDTYALFKPRATKTYYPLNLGVIQSIKMI